MPRLGEYLCQHALLTSTQLEEALSHQSVYGDRLGTNLVELQMLSVDRLAECLSAFHGVPLPPRRWLERPRKAAIKRVTRPLVERIRFLPMRLEGNVLHAAVLDPRDPRLLDDLRFATGCRIEPYVLPEIWMHDWLLSLFKIPRGIRHVETDHVAPPGSAPDAASASFDFQAAQAVQAAREAQAAAPGPGQTAAPAQAGQAGAPPRPGQTTPGFEPGGPAAVSSPRAAEHPLQAAGFSLDAQHPPAPSSAAQSVPGASVRPPQITVQSLADLAIGTSAANLGLLAPGGDDGAPSFWDAPPTKPDAWLSELGSSAGANGYRDEAQRDDPHAIRGEVSAHAAAANAPLPPIPSEPLPSIPNRPPGADPTAPAPLFRQEQRLAAASERNELIDAALAIGARFAQRVGLFIVQQGMLQGAHVSEHGRTRSLDGLLLSLETPCMLTQVASEGVAMRKAPDDRPLDRRILQLMSDAGAIDVGLFPISIKGRVVNVLYASNGTDALGPVAFSALSGLAEQMGATYERMILARKRA